MERRELPKRQTRGQKPELSQAELNADKGFYSSLFGADDLDEDSEPNIEEQQSNAPSMQKNNSDRLAKTRCKSICNITPMCVLSTTISN